MTLPTEMHSSVHLCSFTRRNACLSQAVCKQVLPHFAPRGKVIPAGGEEASPNPCSSVDRDSSWAQAPKRLCLQRCSVKSSVTCWSPTQTVRVLGHISCVNTRLQLSAGPAPLSPQSYRFSAGKRLFTQA